MSQQGLRAAPAERAAPEPGRNSGRAVHYRISSDPPPVTTQLQELWRSRDLFVMLVAREVRVRYRQTLLGVVWVVLQPLVPAVIVAVVLGSFARLPSAGASYVLFALSGFVLFGVFAGAVNRAATSFIRDGQLVTRIYFPRSVLPLASGSVAIVDSAVGVVVLVALSLALGQPLAASLLIAPLIALVALGLGLAVGMAVAAVSAHYRDAAIAVPFALQLLLYASPVVYSTELIPTSLRPLYALDPLVPLVEGFRAAVLGTPWPATPEVVGGTIVGLAATAVAILIFVQASRDLADVV